MCWCFPTKKKTTLIWNLENCVAWTISPTSPVYAANFDAIQSRFQAALQALRQKNQTNNCFLDQMTTPIAFLLIFPAFFEDSDGRLKPSSVITCWIAFLTTSLLAVVVIKYNETMRYTKIYFLLAWNRVCFLLDVCPYKRSHFNTEVSVWKWLNKSNLCAMG